MAFKKLKFWFDQDLAEMLAKKIGTVDSSFKKIDFVNSITEKIEELELKDRIEVIAKELHVFLGNDYSLGVQIFSQILGPENHEETGMFKNFYWIMPIAKYVEMYGLNEFDTSMNIIEEITKRNTAEYAIRPFIEKYPKKTMSKMLAWSTNENRHLRRLSCEGARPRLPWAKKLNNFIENPDPILPILHNLKDDKSKYVQKSVANSLNDILKDNKKIGMQVIDSWNEGEISKERRWIIRHALRNLLKSEDAWALKILAQE